MAAADSSRFGDPRSGYAQHPPPPHPSLPHPYAHHHQQHHQSVLPTSAAAAVPAGIPQQSPAYPPPPQQQQPQHSIPPHHHHQAPPPHPGPPTYGQLPPAAGAPSQGGPHLDASSVAAVPNGRFLPGPAEAPMDSGGGGPSLVHPSYASMPQPHQHQQHQQHQHHPQHPHQQFYAQPPQHPSQHHHHQQHHHHPSSMGHGATAMGDPSGGSAMGAGAGGPPQSHQMAPLLPPPALAGGAGVYVPAPPPVTFPVEPQLDFAQILRLFNMTITASPLTSTAESINDMDPTSRGRKIANLPPSTWNSMLQSALDGLRSLDPMLAEKYVAAAREIQVPEVAEVVVDHVAGASAGPGGGVNGAHHHGGGGAPGVNGNGVVDGDEEGPDGKKRMKRRAKGLPDEEDENGGDGDDNDGSGSDD
ncbi:hypothetical protein FS837_011655 [Tulasnella sp. UAMH 9824]|nr:hypothetical protein FS837_011655 [Tulasnella sp. UAMH 9824]